MRVNRPDHPALAAGQAHSQPPRAPAGTPAAADIQLTSLPAQPVARTSRSLDNYRVAATAALPPPNPQGLRIARKRHYVDLDEGGTVMVAYDAQLETYRARRVDELLPSGPPLYRTGHGGTWGTHPVPASPAQPAISPPPPKRPRPAEEPAPAVVVAKFNYTLRSRYTLLAGPDGQGYYRLRDNDAARHPGAAERVFAFSKDDDHWALVDPPTGRMDASGQSLAPDKLPAWTDRDIWEHYGLHGNAIDRFRADAETLGTPPQWARPSQEGSTRQQLIRALKWAHPDQTAEERGELLRRYNLLPSMLPRLQQALQENGAIPQWAESHKRQSMAETHPRRFDLLEQEVMPQIRKVRNFEPHTLEADFDAYYTGPFLEAFLLRLGYRKNIHGCLYRTDIPAMFRSEDRTPFELARDGCMLAREHHATGSTTKKALSATFSLSDARNYSVGGGPGAGQLRYNTQTNKYPGKRPESESDSDSEASSQGRSSDTSSAASDSTGQPAGTVSSGSGAALSLDSERGYTTYRHRQTTSFTYMIDTREIEVVPGQENRLLNRDSRDRHFFPYDDIEGHISVSSRGIGAERIWLVNSSLTRAANVRAIHAAAGQSAADIESATWDGTDNSTVYDQLIDRVAESGGTVLNWPTDGKVFADDVIWPVPKN
ncbi:hypothetical protein ACW9IK_21645 [Pseudomonas gingeri]